MLFRGGKGGVGLFRGAGGGLGLFAGGWDGTALLGEGGGGLCFFGGGDRRPDEELEPSSWLGSPPDGITMYLLGQKIM